MKNKKAFSAICATALAITVLAGCSKNEGQVVITQDIISSPDLAQQTMADTAGNGKTYAYTWDAQDVDASMEKYEMAMSELATASDVSVPATSGDALSVDDLVNMERERLQAEHDLNPAVSPQEAANIMGTIMEELYGFSHADINIRLQCIQSDSDMFYHIGGGAPMRTTWHGYCDVENGTWVTFGAGISLDAFTGEVVASSCTLDKDMRTAMLQTELPSCIKDSPDNISIDESDASFTPMFDEVSENIKNAANRTLLVGYDKIESISFDNLSTQNNGFGFKIKTSAGKEGLFRWTYFYPYFSYDGYPLRAFAYYNLSYLKG